MRQHDEIVVGHSLAAATYAYLNGSVLILNGLGTSPPFLFDFFEAGFDLDSFMVEPVVYTMITKSHNTKSVGFSKRDLWQRTLFTLSVAGKLPMSDKVQTLRINPEEKAITIITSGNAAITYGYRSLRIFDADNIQGLDPVNPSELETFKVFDWFNVRTGCCHEYDYLSDDDELVQEIYFYPSPRMGTKNHKAKDLVAVSYLTREQLNNIDYSDVAVRFKILKMMKAVGVRGARNGRDVKNPTKYKYYAVRIEATERQVIPVKEKYEGAAQPDVIFDSRTEEEIILQHSNKKRCSYKILSSLIKK